MSNLASDDSPQEPEPPDAQGAQAPSPAGAEKAGEPQQPSDPSPWLEPKVQSLAIFTELFRSGDKTEGELEQLLARYTTTMAWADFWAREGYIAEVVRGSERRYAVSGKAALVLELP